MLFFICHLWLSLWLYGQEKVSYADQGPKSQLQYSSRAVQKWLLEPCVSSRVSSKAVFEIHLLKFTGLNLINCKTILHHPHCCYVYIPGTTCLHIPLAHPCLYYYLLSPQYTVLHILFYCTFYSLFFLINLIFYLYWYIFSCVVLHILHCPLSGPDLIYISLQYKNTTQIKLRWALFVTYTIIQSIMRSEMCSLHLTNPSGAVGSRHCGARGTVGGVSALLKGLTSVVDTSCRDLNPQPWVTLGFKSNDPLGHDFRRLCACGRELNESFKLIHEPIQWFANWFDQAFEQKWLKRTNHSRMGIAHCPENSRRRVWNKLKQF